jgi:acetyl esterase/lipase
MRTFIRHVIRPWLLSGDLARQRRNFERLRDPRAKIQARVETVQAGAISGAWFTPEGADPDRVLYYLHGGAFVACSVASYSEGIARIARALGMRAFAVDYRLAPEHPYPAALDDSVAGYRFLLSSGVRPENIVIAGDSAGGALTLGTLLSARDAKLPLPRAAVCLSPLTDCTRSGESWQTRVKDEAMLSVPFCAAATRMYLGDRDPSAPLASPLFADLRGLPPIAIHVGTHELLLDDSLRFAKHAQAQGVEVTLRVWDGMWHVFPLFAVPESRACVREIANFIRDRFEPAGAGPGVVAARAASAS